VLYHSFFGNARHFLSRVTFCNGKTDNVTFCNGIKKTTNEKREAHQKQPKKSFGAM